MNKEAFNKLRWLLSEYSERTTCAGWCHNIEFIAWKELNGPESESNLTGKESFILKELIKELNGWVLWDEILNEEAFIPMDKWIKVFNEWCLIKALREEKWEDQEKMMNDVDALREEFWHRLFAEPEPAPR